ncbi:hypothetical protein [Pseudomonas phage vB_PaeP_4029]|nr:hypothetical protein [Pseudomonas phage vB_PaeP_4029]UYE96518.1 hypothetical protein [Pseudomonas phage vB_PaeP_4032]UYE96604.1 hypothetical protein [Pseudomonas phage vB_PaeP_4034]
MWAGFLDYRFGTVEETVSAILSDQTNETQLVY